MSDQWYLARNNQKHGPYKGITMSDQWYLARNNQKHGPYSSAQLQEFAKTGQLLPTDMLWKEGMQKWVPASQVKSLFQQASPKPVQQAAPKKPQPVVSAAKATLTQPSAEAFQALGNGPSGKAGRGHPSEATGIFRGKKLVAIAGGGAGLCLLVVLLLVLFGGKERADQAGSSPEVAKGSNPASKKGGSTSDDSPAALDKPAFSVLPASAMKNKSWDSLRKLDRKSPHAVALSPDGKLLALSDTSLRLYEAESGREKVVIEEKMPAGTFITFSPDGALLAFAGDRRPKITLWDVRNGKLAGSLENPYTGVMPAGFPGAGTPYAMRCSLAFSPNADSLITAGHPPTSKAKTSKKKATAKDDLVVVWNTRTMQPETTIQGQEPLAAASKAPVIAFRGATPSEAIVWDLATKQQVARIDAQAKGMAFGKPTTITKIIALTLSPDASLLVIAVRLGDDGTKIARYQHQLQLWNVARQTQEKLPFGADDDWDEIYALEFAPHGSVLAVAGDFRVDGSRKQIGLVQLWDIEARKVAGLMGHEHRVNKVAFSADGKYLASISQYSGNEVRVWKEQSGSGGRFVFVNAADEKARLTQLASLYKEQNKKQKEMAQKEADSQELARVYSDNYLSPLSDSYLSPVSRG